MMISLPALGYNEFFRNEFSKIENTSYLPARIISEHKGIYRVQDDQGEYLGEISGKLRYTAINRQDFPVVGDWVAIQRLEGEGKCIIHVILPRKTKLSRKSPGKTIEEQILCSNIDYIFIVQSMDATFNVNRIERYLSISWESGAIPVVILSKKDLCESPESILLEAESAAIGAKVHAISSLEEDSLGIIKTYLTSGNTIAFIGHSGAGKSTLINKLSRRELQKTNEIREADSRGKHTTTHRELFVLDNELLIDTPGLREIQLWGDESMLQETFADIDSLSALCKFVDCKHESEPGCKIKEAIANGEISEERFANYEKMKRELEYLESRVDESAMLQRKQKERKFHKTFREVLKQKYDSR